MWSSFVVVTTRNGHGDRMELVREYWLLILAALVILALAALLLLRRRQRVELSNEGAPVRPHMAQSRKAGEGHGIASEAAAALGDVSGQIIDAPVHANLPGASGPPDDLQRLKGVGPKFVAILNQFGIIRFDQLARLSEADIEQLDKHLGPFRGRLQRDQIPLQADYLARGDEDGFEQRFGKL
jgi:predicted flap endonuclease-1-like 5' DNA nuclease